MTDLTERLRAWAVRGKLLQPYEVKPLLREAATTLETLTQKNARLREAGWRGIESAPGPTDEFSFYGPLILVWDGENVSAAKKDRTGSFTDLELVEQDGDWMSIFPNPTHWMPLPPAPAHKALGGGNE